MTMAIDFAVRGNCWNMLDTYGEICVRCGCCQKDTTERRKARLETLKRWLEETENFDGWFDDEHLREIQERNVASNIKWLKKKINYYESKLSGEKAGDGDV